MIPFNPKSTERTRQILEDLEAVRENLFALSDDIWLSINHNDSQTLKAEVDFKLAYNSKAEAFDKVASELSALVQQYTRVRLGEAEQTGGENREENARIVMELNREQPHSLVEDFTYKRPHGFILEGKGTTGITTWQRMYQLTLQHLFAKNPSRFREMCVDPDFISSRGNPTFADDPAKLRKPLKVADRTFAESNLSANGIRDVIERVLIPFEIPREDMLIFLRQDRDAGRERDGQ